MYLADRARYREDRPALRAGRLRRPAVHRADRAGRPRGAQAAPSATPPAHTSVVGGERLAKPGTQVNLAAGVPVLPKELSARSWIVADAESGDVLAAHNAHWRLAPRAP